MKKYIFIVMACLLCVIASGAPLDGKKVSSTAKWIVHTDLNKLKKSDIGKYILSAANDKEQKKIVDFFKDKLKFDPLNDLDGITIYGTDEEQECIIILCGDFDVKSVNEWFHSKGIKKYKPYGKHQIYGLIDEGSSKPDQANHEDAAFPPDYMTIYDKRQIIISERKQDLYHALDVQDGKSPNMHNSPLIARLKELSDSDFITAVVDISDIEDLEPQAMIFKKANEIIVGIGEVDKKITGALIVNAESEQEAQALKAIVDGMLALAVIKADDKPELSILTKAKVNITGKQLKASLAAPVAELLKSLKLICLSYKQADSK